MCVIEFNRNVENGKKSPFFYYKSGLKNTICIM